jgi:hypothetical protein
MTNRYRCYRALPRVTTPPIYPPQYTGNAVTVRAHPLGTQKRQTARRADRRGHALVRNLYFFGEPQHG